MFQEDSSGRLARPAASLGLKKEKKRYSHVVVDLCGLLLGLVQLREAEVGALEYTHRSQRPLP